jgi:hypothetical protein
MKTPQENTKAYLGLGRRGEAFAKMVADFQRMGSGEFLKLYPDYDYNGTDYVALRARDLAAALNSFADETLKVRA